MLRTVQGAVLAVTYGFKNQRVYRPLCCHWSPTISSRDAAPRCTTLELTGAEEGALAFRITTAHVQNVSGKSLCPRLAVGRHVSDLLLHVIHFACALVAIGDFDPPAGNILVSAKRTPRSFP